ncbi:hypothetical protein MTR67_042493 [Solanum verrucosum]|uniref:TCP domain-containing protein n=1 Tax=Solanum verrucosum TaxID=315347 RepID=A0AAF0UPG4_SOLVR|nr:hypothetical protein MTR67_042493 [Solanum verrucosum]
MNHQLQVSNENEDKSSSQQEDDDDENKDEFFHEILQSDYQHLQQWPNYFTPPSATLVPKHQNNTQCPSHKEETKRVSLKRKPKRAKKDVMEVHGSRIVRATGRKDRHSKVSTATGPKDRRVRLSPNTAIQFYDVQDRLGYDRPSKAIDWLIKEAQRAINALEKTPFQVFSNKIDSTNKALNVRNEEGQFALEQSWSVDKKTELEELARHSSKLNATMQHSADQFPERCYKEQSSKVCQANDTQIVNSSANGSKIQSFCEFQTHPQAHFHSQTKRQSPNDAKIQSFCEYQTHPQSHFQSETKKQSPNVAKTQSFCELQTHPQGHFHSQTKKQPTNDAKIQSFCELQTHPQGHFQSETKNQSPNVAKTQSFCELQTYPQGQFHSETRRQSAKDAKIQSFCELQTYPQGQFHSETKRQSAKDAKIQSFCELQTYPQGQFHSETKRQSAKDAKIQSFCELQTYPQGHFQSETKNQSAQLGNFFSFQPCHQNESISFSGDHNHHGFSFSPQNFPTVLGQNQMFNYLREPLQSTSTFPQTISYSNNIGFANDGLLGLCTTPITQQQQEDEQGSISTTLLHYQD